MGSKEKIKYLNLVQLHLPEGSQFKASHGHWNLWSFVNLSHATI